MISIKLDADEKADFQRLAASMGLSLSSLFINAVRQVRREGALTLREGLTPTPWLVAQMEEADRGGADAAFSLPDQQAEMDAYLDGLIGS